MADDVVTRLQEVFRDVFDDETIAIRREMTARDIDDWDSLTHVQLLVNVEREFGLRFKSSQVANLKNVGEMIDLIQSLLKA